MADLVIDNGAPYGDAVIAVSERIGSMGPVSTITGAAIVNAIAVEAAGRLDAEGLPVDVWISANSTVRRRPVPTVGNRSRRSKFACGAGTYSRRNGRGNGNRKQRG